MECDKPLPLTEFDRVTVSESTQMIKAVIPFLDTSTKKTICVFIRFQELMQTIEFFKKPFHTESTSSFYRSNFTMKDILYETMPYISKADEDTFNMMQNFMEMFNVFNMYKDMDQSQDFQSIINIVKNMNDSNGTNTSDAPEHKGTDTGNDTNNNTMQNDRTAKDSTGSNANHTANPYQNLLSEEQKKLYEKFLSDIDQINFDDHKQE